MKAKIKGKLYNTETSEMLGTRDNKLPFDDPRLSKSSLYRTQHGDHFLVLDCGPLSNFAYETGRDSWIHMIVPLTIAEAHTWAFLSLDEETTIELFGGLPYNCTVWLNIEVSCVSVLAAKCMAAAKGITVEKLLYTFLEPSF